MGTGFSGWVDRNMHGIAGMARIRKPVKTSNSLSSRILYGLSLVTLLFGLVSLGWAVWPMPTDAVQLQIPAGPLPGAPAETSYASQADYVLVVAWPRVLRSGDTGMLSISLAETGQVAELDQGRGTQVVLGVPLVSGLKLDPPGQIQSAMAPGKDLSFSWSITSTLVGDYPGEVVISLGFFDQVQDALIAVPVAVVDIEVQVAALWGMERGLVLWLGVVGLILWGALFVMGRVAQEKGGVAHKRSGV